MDQRYLLQAAHELTKALNAAVDDNLPDKLAGIVKLHAGLGVGAAFIPVPGADLAAASANTWTMYVRINKELDLPFGENVAKSLAAGVVTNIGANIAGLLLVATGVKFLPGLGTVGGAALMAGSIYAVTIAAGTVYMKAITKLIQRKDPAKMTADDLKKAADEVMKDKKEIRSIVRDAKKSYKREEAAS